MSFPFLDCVWVWRCIIYAHDDSEAKTGVAHAKDMDGWLASLLDCIISAAFAGQHLATNTQ